MRSIPLISDHFTEEADYQLFGNLLPTTTLTTRTTTRRSTTTTNTTTTDTITTNNFGGEGGGGEEGSGGGGGKEVPTIVLGDFAPLVFDDIRRMAGQTERGGEEKEKEKEKENDKKEKKKSAGGGVYLVSLGTEGLLASGVLGGLGVPLVDVVSTSRSGSIFFATADRR